NFSTCARGMPTVMVPTRLPGTISVSVAASANVDANISAETVSMIHVDRAEEDDPAAFEPADGQGARGASGRGVMLAQVARRPPLCAPFLFRGRSTPNATKAVR